MGYTVTDRKETFESLAVPYYLGDSALMRVTAVLGPAGLVVLAAAVLLFVEGSHAGGLNIFSPVEYPTYPSMAGAPAPCSSAYCARAFSASPSLFVMRACAHPVVSRRQARPAGFPWTCRAHPLLRFCVCL